MRITIKTKNLIYFELLFLCVIRLVESAGVPHFFVFICDVINLLIFINLIHRKSLGSLLRNPLVHLQLVWLIVGVIVAFFSGVNLLLVFWSLRNLFRFLIFFGACIKYLSCDDVLKLFSYFEKLFLVNCLIVVIEYFLGFRQDALGGIFGTESGANAYNNVFLILICSYHIAQLFERKGSRARSIFFILLSIGIAILSEIKLFLFELLLIIVVNAILIAVIQKKHKAVLRLTGFVVLGVALVFISANLIAKLYPNLSNNNFLTIEGLRYILSRTSGYSGSGDINRLTAFSMINNLPEFSTISSKIFGLGLGSAEYSTSWSIMNSPFYLAHNSMHYYWFSHAWTYIEGGYVGTAFYLLSFIATIFSGVRILKRCHGDTYMIISGITVLFVTFMLYVYNQSLRMESAYFIYFAISMIYLVEKEMQGKQHAINQRHSTGI